MDTKKRLAEMQLVNKRASGGKEYWVYGLEQLGVYEERGILRFRPATNDDDDDDDDKQDGNSAK